MNAEPHTDRTTKSSHPPCIIWFLPLLLKTESHSAVHSICEVYNLVEYNKYLKKWGKIRSTVYSTIKGNK